MTSINNDRFVNGEEQVYRRDGEESEQSNAILFFDEADALFGKRSEVRDSHDKRFKLAGGNIMNIFVNAAFLAAEEYMK